MSDEPYRPRQRLSLTNGAVLTVALTALFDAFDIAFPTRDTTTDGWIGNAAHQAEVSGHNPDDTPGVRAEYSDADTKPEVRAIDVDADLRTTGYRMQDAIDAILATERDRRRLAYIIYAETIWSAKSNWQPNHYGGSDPHTTHAHFSGTPDYDEDGAAWSVAKMGAGTMALTDDDVRKIWSFFLGASGPKADVAQQQAYAETTGLRDTLKRVEEKLDGLLSAPVPATQQHTHTTGEAIPANNAGV